MEHVNPITDTDLLWLDHLHKYPPRNLVHPFSAEGHVWTAYPAIRERLRLAEEEGERLKAANAGLVGTIRKLDPVNLCSWFDDYGGEEELAQWLAKRDAKMKALGAAEVWDLVAERSKLVGDSAGEQYERAEAARLRREAGE